MRSGGGGGSGARGLEDTGLTAETLNTRQTQRVQGNIRWTTFGLMMPRTLKGPLNLGDDFLEPVFRGKWIAIPHPLDDRWVLE